MSRRSMRDLRDIRLAARTFAGGIIALAVLSIYLHLTHSALPFWHNERGFGPFPNRNQTGDLFGISTVVVLGCMQDDFRRGHKRWVLWLIGAGVLIAALVLAFSRAGILILVLGVTAWLARLALRKWSGGGIAIALSVLLTLLAGLLIFGGETIERFNLRFGSGSAARFRISLAHLSGYLGDDQGFALVRHRAGKFRERVCTLS